MKKQLQFELFCIVSKIKLMPTHSKLMAVGVITVLSLAKFAGVDLGL